MESKTGSYFIHSKVCRASLYNDRQQYNFAQAGNSIPFAGTVAKFINNFSLLLLLFNGVTSDGTIAETCTNADC